MDVISKEGPLFLQGVKFGKKIWRKSWLILFEPSPAGIGRMELYDLRDGGVRMGFSISRPAGLRKTDKRVIRLTDCLSITPAPGESCPTDCSAFFLNTSSCTYTIAAPTRDDWVSVLCQLAFQKSQRDADSGRGQKDKYLPLADNELYSTWGTGQFQVSVQSTEASQRCRMSGSYLLSADKETVSLLDLKTGQAIHRWPYRLLRRFGQVKGGIMIEAGRRCHSGEGQFIFLSKQGSQIHRAIEDAIMHQSVQELLAQASALPKESPSQPPSPKNRPQVKKPPPVSVSQERPRPAIQCKRGQQIHKAIKEALARPSHTALPPPPPSPKPKTQGKEVKKERAFLPAPPTHKVIDGALKYQNVQKLKTPPPPPPPPPPLPKNRPQVAAKANPERPGPALARRNISLPVPPPCVKSSPDDVFYSIICPQPRTRVPTPPPSLPQHFRMHTNPDAIKEKEWTSSQESSENPTYINLSNIEDLYSTVNFAAKRKNRQTEEDSGGEKKQTADGETPVDFKQTLSSILSKEMSKMTPARSHGGSCEQLDRIDELRSVSLLPR